MIFFRKNLLTIIKGFQPLIAHIQQFYLFSHLPRMLILSISLPCSFFFFFFYYQTICNYLIIWRDLLQYQKMDDLPRDKILTLGGGPAFFFLEIFYAIGSMAMCLSVSPYVKFLLVVQFCSNMNAIPTK